MQAAKHPQREHIDKKVKEIGVQEHMGEQLNGVEFFQSPIEKSQPEVKIDPGIHTQNHRCQQY